MKTLLFLFSLLSFDEEMKLNLQIICLLLVLSFSSGANAQLRSIEVGEDSLEMVKTPWLHRWSGMRFYHTENSFGIVPSVQGFKELYVGLGISKARFVVGEGGGSGFGTTLGVDYNPIDNVVAPKINLWATGFAFFFGGNVGISGYYYIKGSESNFVLRPEIGIGYLKVFINYGYNLFLRSNFNDVGKHTFTLSYYRTFLPFKEKRSSKK